MYSEWSERDRSQFAEPEDFSRLGAFLAGAAFGAGIMFLLDPRGGRRRRALIRDKFVRGNRVARAYGGKFARHLRNEVRGEFEERRARMKEEDVADDVLVERVRAQIGHVLKHPGSVDVIADRGVVVLRGPVLRGEIEKICNRLDDTRGVRDYHIELREFDSADNIPGLQGHFRGEHERFVG